MTKEDLDAQMAAVDAEIDALHEQLKPLHERRNRLQAILDGPAVRPVAHYWCYHSRYEEVCDTVEQAFAFLDSGEDAGSLSSIGVTVGGAEVERPAESVR